MNPPFFRATYSPSLKITTAVILAILFLAGGLGGTTGLLISGALIPASLLLVITGFSVQRGNLVVHSLVWSKSFDLCEPGRYPRRTRDYRRLDAILWLGRPVCLDRLL